MFKKGDIVVCTKTHSAPWTSKEDFPYRALKGKQYKVLSADPGPEYPEIYLRLGDDENTEWWFGTNNFILLEEYNFKKKLNNLINE